MILLDKFFLRWLVLLMLALLLSSCAHQPDRSFSEANAAQRLQGKPPEHFYIQGKISIKKANKGYAASFNLRKEAKQSLLNIVSPLGQTLAQMMVKEDRAVLMASDQIYEANSIEELTETWLNWRLPLSGLYYWLYGFVMPDRDFSIYKAGENSIQFSQEDWLIRLENYQQNEYGFYPKRLLLNREDLSLRLSILEQKHE